MQVKKILFGLTLGVCLSIVGEMEVRADYWQEEMQPYRTEPYDTSSSAREQVIKTQYSSSTYSRIVVMNDEPAPSGYTKESESVVWATERPTILHYDQCTPWGNRNEQWKYGVLTYWESGDTYSGTWVRNKIGNAWFYRHYDPSHPNYNLYSNVFLVEYCASGNIPKYKYNEAWSDHAGDIVINETTKWRVYEYRKNYQTVTKTMIYGKWSDWSAWQDSPITKTPTLDVRTRPLYTYREYIDTTAPVSDGCFIENSTDKQFDVVCYNVRDDNFNKNINNAAGLQSVKIKITLANGGEKTANMTQIAGTNNYKYTINIDDFYGVKTLYSMVITASDKKYNAGTIGNLDHALGWTYSTSNVWFEGNPSSLMYSGTHYLEGVTTQPTNYYLQLTDTYIKIEDRQSEYGVFSGAYPVASLNNGEYRLKHCATIDNRTHCFTLMKPSLNQQGWSTLGNGQSARIGRVTTDLAQNVVVELTNGVLISENYGSSWESNALTLNIGLTVGSDSTIQNQYNQGSINPRKLLLRDLAANVVVLEVDSTQTYGTWGTSFKIPEEKLEQLSPGDYLIEGKVGLISNNESTQSVVTGTVPYRLTNGSYATSFLIGKKQYSFIESATGGLVLRVYANDVPPTPYINAETACSKNPISVTVGATMVPNGYAIQSVEAEMTGAYPLSFNKIENGKTYVIKNNGYTTIRARATDTGGNQSNFITKTVCYDTQSPVITTNATEEWLNESQWINFQISERGVAGLKTVNYVITGANEQPLTQLNHDGTQASLDFYLENEGETIITLYAVDTAGNEVSEQFTLRLDKTEPEGCVNPATAIDENETRLQLCATDTEPSSGIKSAEYRLFGASVKGWTIYQHENIISIQNEGTTYLELKIQDNANNVYTSKQTIILDLTPPTVNLAINEKWTNIDAVIGTFEFKDESGGTGPDTANYTLSGATVQETPITFEDKDTLTITAPGVTTIEIEGRDNAGNITRLTRQVKIDRELPTIEIEVEEGWSTNQIQQFKLVANDTGGSELCKVEYRLNGQDWVSSLAGATVLLSEEGTSHVEARAEDCAGNKTDAAPKDVQLDREPPTLELTHTGTGDWQNTPIWIRVVATDTGSGVNRIVGPGNNGATAPEGTTVQSLSTSMEVIVNDYYHFSAYDNVGNYTEQYILIEKLDFGVPTVRFVNPKPSWTNTDVTITITAEN